ncbi:MAG: hypothetical protein QOC86_3110 [Gaiellales bacterium]|nr:hypothetical protein [Gaiellales bacterium]
MSAGRDLTSFRPPSPSRCHTGILGQRRLHAALQVPEGGQLRYVQTFRIHDHWSQPTACSPVRANLRQARSQAARSRTRRSGAFFSGGKTETGIA